MATSILSLISATIRRSLGFRASYARYDPTWERNITVPTEADYLSIPAVLCAIRLISESVATLPLHLYRRDKDGGRAKESHHPVRDLFVHPNEVDLGCTLREVLVHDALVYGRGYAKITRTEDSRVPMELTIIRADHVIEDVDKQFGTPIYRISDYSGAYQETVCENNMLVLRGFMGRSLVDACGESLALAQAAQKYATKVFENGARPGGVLTHPGRLADNARLRLRESWEKLHSGPEAAHRVAILEEGMTFQTVSGDAESTQLEQLRQFQILEVCRIFGIPPSKMRISGSGGYASLEQENLQFVQDCLRPWLVRFEAAANRRLLNPVEREEYYFEHSIEGMLRADTMTRYKSYSIARNWSLMSPNEIRAKENLPPIEGGDIVLAPVNMQPLTDTSPGARAPTTDSPTAGLDEFTTPDSESLAEGDSNAE